jgi:hypothetical protein
MAPGAVNAGGESPTRIATIRTKSPIVTRIDHPGVINGELTSDAHREV